MSNIKYLDLLSEVLPHLSGLVSDPLAEAAIKNAVIEFCRDSWIWRHFADVQDVVAGNASYDFEPPAGSEVAQVLSCVLDGVVLTASSTDAMNELLPTWQSVPGAVKYFLQLDTTALILAPLPDQNSPHGLLMTLALQPKRAAIGFPQWIAAQYMEALAGGALSRLMSIPAKPWTDLAGAAMHHARFHAAMGNAKASAVQGLGRAILRVRCQH